MSLSKGRTQQTVEALKQLLCGVRSHTGDIFGNMRTAKVCRKKKALDLQTGWDKKRQSVRHCVKLSTQNITYTELCTKTCLDEILKQFPAIKTAN